MGLMSQAFGVPNKRTNELSAVHWISTTVDPRTTCQTLRDVAEAFPPKKVMMEGTYRIFLLEQDNDAGYAVAATWEVGRSALTRAWSLIAEARDGYAWYELAHARTRSGEIVDRRELEKLLELWMQRLRQLDPHAKAVKYQS